MPLALMNTAWPYWINATTTQTTQAIWPAWTATSTATTIYQSWVTGQAQLQGMSSQQGYQAAHNRLGQQASAEQYARTFRAQQQPPVDEEYVRQQSVRRELERRAEEKALLLLNACLILEERLRLAQHGHIFVRGFSGCRYRIRKGRVGNVDVVSKEGRVTHALCAHPMIAVPDFDTMLAQKLALETDDESFCRTANRHPAHSEQIMPVIQ